MFEQIYFVYSIAIIIPLMGFFLIWRGWVRQSVMRKIGDQELVQSLVAQVSPFRRRVKALFWLATIALILLALGRPTWGFEEDIIRTEGIQIIFAIDVSRSMDATDVSPTRLQRARLDVLDMMTALEGNDLGIVLFARDAFTYMPLTYDLSAAEIFLADIDTNMMTNQGTNIPDAIERALGSFEQRSQSQKVIVLITDGESHEGDAITAAERAREENVIIYTIGYGTQEGSTIPLYDETGTLIGYQTTADSNDAIGTLVNTTLNFDLLQRIAEETNGAYITGGTSLEAIITDIQGLESGEIGEQVISRPIARFPIFVGLALLLLSLEMLISDAKREVA
ncbi:MAG: VWA domain-containing protein [Chloroflexota bacterium]